MGLPLDFIVVPAPRRLFGQRARIETALAALAPGERRETLEALGDLALALARRPRKEWADTRAAMALHIFRGGHLDAERFVAVGLEHGLLVPHGDHLVRPESPGLVHTLAAMRMVATDDEPEDLDRRLRGGLFDVVAMAVALEPDLDSARGLARLIGDRTGPFEDVLEMAMLQVAYAYAWGAPVDDDVAQHVLSRSFAWTAPDGPASHGLGGAAALVEGLRRGGPAAASLRPALIERLDALSEALSDPELAGHPALRAALQWTLLPLAADADDLAGIEALAARAPLAITLLGGAVQRTWEPGDARDEVLVALARGGIEAGVTDSLAVLGGISGPRADAEGLVQEALKDARSAPHQAALGERAVAACGAVAAWGTVSELTAHLLGRLVLAPAHASLRLEAASAIAMHPEVTEAMLPILISTLQDELSQDHPGLRTAATGCLLQLGSDADEAPALAVALVADGVPAELLAPALEAALRRNPALVLPIRELWRMADEPLKNAGIALLEPLAHALHQEHEDGPFSGQPPLSWRARQELLELVLPEVGDLDHPARCGHAAVVAGWLGRGDLDVSETLRVVHDAVSDDALRGMLALGLGAAGATSAEIVRALGEDVAHGAPELAAMAAAGLAVMGDATDDLDPVDDLVPIYRARLDYEGPQQAPIRDLLFAMASLPLTKGLHLPPPDDDPEDT